MPTKNLKDIRRSLGARCNKVLLMYRKHCAPAVQPGQVSQCHCHVLPNSLTITAHPSRRVQAPSALYFVHAQVKATEGCVISWKGFRRLLIVKEAM